MAVQNLNPIADVENDGWAIVGGDTSMWAALASNVDTNYLTSPASSGVAMVSYPIDTSTIPAGAAILSVSVAVRASLGTGVPTAAQPASLTAAMVAVDDPSVYVQRTIYPTNGAASPNTFTVSNYTRDPLGQPWDIEGLNNIELRVYSSNAIADVVRVYELFLAVYYSTVPTIVVNSPTGTIPTASPTIQWSYTQVDGNPQASAQYKVFPATTVASPSFNPDISSPVFDGFVQGAVTSVIIPGSIPSNSYYFYVQSTSSKGAKSLWSYQQANVFAPSPGIPGVLDPSGATPAGQGIVAVTPDYANGCTVLTVQDTSNLMSVHEADVTIDDSGARWTLTNCTAVESTDYLFPGDQNQVWKFVSISSGNMVISSGYQSVTQSSIASNQSVTATAQVLAGTTGRSVNCSINYTDNAYNSISTVTGTFITDLTGGAWSELETVDTGAPQNASYVSVTFEIVGAAASEAHYFTHVGVMYGNQTPYSNGGHASRNLLDAWYSNGQGTQPAADAWVMSPGSTYATSSTFGATANGFDGALCNTMTYTGPTATIGLRAAGTVYSDTTSSNVYTLNKPAGTASGDLMVAFVTSTYPVATITPPAGWQLVDSSTVDSAGIDICLFVLARTAGASEPSTWSGALSANSVRREAVVVAYSGAASLSSQFIAEAQSATSGAGTVFTSPMVVNTDPSAWRISAFAVDSTVGASTMTANTQAPGGNPIEFVSAAPSWKSHDSTLNYTINRPPGVSNGDLMIAAVSCDYYAGTIIPPTGWTVVRQEVGSYSPFQGAYAVLKRTAGSSEPSAWTGTMSSSSNAYPKITECVAYRNCAPASSQFIADAIGPSSYPTLWGPTVTNTNANAWQVAAFFSMGSASNGPNPISARAGADVDNSTKRAGDALQVGGTSGPGVGADAVMISDSNGPVAAGGLGGSASCAKPVSSANSWVGVILPQTSIPGAPANETSRVTTSAGSSSPYSSLGVFDSNGVVGTAPWSVSATSSAAFKVAAGWIGLIRPAAATVGGLVSATIQSPVDISALDPSILSAAGNQVTVGASFEGSVAGTTLLTASFYRGPVLISSQTLSGGAFNSTAGNWSDCAAQFPVPDGTTRIGMTLASPGHSVSDVVGWQRAFLNIGPDPSYRTGTAASAHPVWSYPQIQYADNNGDGFGPWMPLPGVETNVPSFGQDKYLMFRDHTITPLVSRKYRMQTVSYGLHGDVFVSGWGPDSNAVTFTAQTWWLKDIADPANNIALSVKWQDLKVSRQSSAVQFQGLGEQYPVVLTDGFKSDTFSLSMIPVDQSDHVAFVELIASNRTLFLQSDADQAWWVQCISPIDRTILSTADRQSNPFRQIDLTFVEVEPLP